MITSLDGWSLRRARLCTLTRGYQLHTHPLADHVTPASQLLPLSICLGQQVLQPRQLFLQELTLLPCMGHSSWQLRQSCEYSIQMRPGPYPNNWNSPQGTLLLPLLPSTLLSLLPLVNSSNPTYSWPGQALTIKACVGDTGYHSSCLKVVGLLLQGSRTLLTEKSFCQICSGVSLSFPSAQR